MNFSEILEAHEASQRPFQNIPILMFLGHAPTCLGLAVNRLDEGYTTIIIFDTTGEFQSKFLTSNIALFSVSGGAA